MKCQGGCSLLAALHIALAVLHGSSATRDHSSSHKDPFESRPYVEHFAKGHHSSHTGTLSHEDAELDLDRDSIRANQMAVAHTGEAQERKPKCWGEDSGLGQYPKLTGTWQDSSTDGFRGFYDASRDCPEYGHDFDCRRPYKGTPEGRVEEEFSKVFTPDQCSLDMLDPARFDELLAGRRLIMFGDSIMRLQWLSLACMLRSQSVEETGVGVSWSETGLPQGEYVSSWGQDGVREAAKQFAGEFTLKLGGQVIVRDVGIFNDTLMRELIEELGQLKGTDIVLINWGAWYPRFTWGYTEAPWEAWQEHMAQLFRDFLVPAPGRVIWKEYTPQHFEGALGSDPGYARRLDGGPWQTECAPARVGEFWFNDWIADFLSATCEGNCSHIQVLPIFNMSLPRYNSHFGSFGRGAADGYADCLHWCHNVADWWNVLLYNMLL